MFNHVGIMGRLSRTPELRRTQAGAAVVSFSIAVDRDIKGQDGERAVDWIECVAWRGTAEFIAKYFQKGQSILVSGRLQTRGWTDKDGSKRRSTEVLVDTAYFAGAAPARSSAPVQAPTQPPYYMEPTPEYFDVPEKEELPF